MWYTISFNTLIIYRFVLSTKKQNVECIQLIAAQKKLKKTMLISLNILLLVKINLRTIIIQKYSISSYKYTF